MDPTEEPTPPEAPRIPWTAPLIALVVVKLPAAELGLNTGDDGSGTFSAS
jgi:hypothetical protein